MYASTPFTSSSSSYFGPVFSTRPQREYSTNNWYDFKSSNPELSDKVIYRMQAEFFRLQAMDMRGEVEPDHGTCLLNCECKKNPFNKTHLLDYRGHKKSSLAESFNPHWTEESTRNNFRNPPSYRNVSETLREYREIKELRDLRDKAHQTSDRLISNNSLFEKNPAMKMTFGEEKPAQTLQRKETVESFWGRNSNVGNVGNVDNFENKNENSSVSTSKPPKSPNRFIENIRRSGDDETKKVEWRGKTFFPIKLETS